jgi:hypothetical protein
MAESKEAAKTGQLRGGADFNNLSNPAVFLGNPFFVHNRG